MEGLSLPSPEDLMPVHSLQRRIRALWSFAYIRSFHHTVQYECWLYTRIQFWSRYSLLVQRRLQGSSCIIYITHYPRHTCSQIIMFQSYDHFLGRITIGLGTPFLPILHMVQTSTDGKRDHIAVRPVIQVFLSKVNRNTFATRTRD